MRKRGKVAPIHITVRMRKVLLKKVRISCQSQLKLPKEWPNGHSKPPRKSIEPRIESPQREEYSVRAKIMLHRIPLNSTQGPPTSSDSPIGMSKGRRESSARVAVRRMKK